MSRSVSARGLVLALLAASASPAAAIGFEHRWTVGFRLGNYFGADKQQGGFRSFGGGVGATGRQQRVSIGEVPLGSISVGYGVKQWKRAQMTLEFEASRFSTSVGKETAFLDRDASTRVVIPPATGTRETGDESFETFQLGTITMTPVFASALFHWAGSRDPERGDFYFGGGPGIVLASMQEASDFRNFVADHDGVDDVKTGNAFALMVKVGANLRIAKSHPWYLYFEAEFFSTAMTPGQSQVRWSGADFFAGTQNVDTNNDGSPDTTLSSDYHLVDPGHLRMDGAIGGIGLRYRFGGKKPVPAAAPAKPDAAPAP